MSGAGTLAGARGAALADEDLARAGWYELLAAIFRAPPDAAALRRLAALGDLPEDDARTPLGRALGEFARACAAADADEVRQEFDDVFLGTGRPQVFVNSSWYLSGFLHEKPLADLRADLARRGLARREGIAETEDHVAALCDAMRALVVLPDAGGIDAQRDFFARRIAPWQDPLCDAIDACESATFYRHAGRLLRAFLDVERQSFEFET